MGRNVVYFAYLIVFCAWVTCYSDLQDVHLPRRATILGCPQSPRDFLQPPAALLPAPPSLATFCQSLSRERCLLR